MIQLHTIDVPAAPPTRGRRLSWDEYGLQLASTAARRASCPRLAVGAVILDPAGRVASTGYNGAPAGEPHCIDAGCLVDERSGGCARAVHAERNAIDHAHPDEPLDGHTIYLTDSPCVDCASRIRDEGITRAVFARCYRDRSGIDLLVAAGLVVEWHAYAKVTFPRPGGGA